LVIPIGVKRKTDRLGCKQENKPDTLGACFKIISIYMHM